MKTLTESISGILGVMGQVRTWEGLEAIYADFRLADSLAAFRASVWIVFKSDLFMAATC